MFGSRLFLAAAVCCFVIAAARLDASINPNAPVNDPALWESINNNPDSTWTAGPSTRFSGMTWAEAAIMNGLSSLNITAGAKSGMNPDATDIPAAFDARQQWPDCIHPIMNQGQCGSCWAFGGSTETLSDRMCIAGGPSVVLSPEYMISCDDLNLGCNGGLLQTAWAFMEHDGVVSFDCFPYNATVESCPASGSCPGGQGPPSLYYAQEFSGRAPLTETGIQLELMAHGPVSTGFMVFQDFYGYQSGVYQHMNGSFVGLHAVKIVGWGVDGTTPYWIVANSWGTGWGQEGFFWILRGQDECGIEAASWVGLSNYTTGASSSGSSSSPSTSSSTSTSASSSPSKTSSSSPSASTSTTSSSSSPSSSSTTSGSTTKPAGTTTSAGTTGAEEKQRAWGTRWGA